MLATIVKTKKMQKVKKIRRLRCNRWGSSTPATQKNVTFSFSPHLLLCFFFSSTSWASLQKSPCGLASEAGHTDTVLSLLRGPSRDSMLNWANWVSHPNSLHVACLGGHVKSCQTAFGTPRHQCEFDRRISQNFSLFPVGVNSGKCLVVKVMLKDPRVDLVLRDRTGCTPLWHACCDGCYEVVEWLIVSG